MAATKTITVDPATRKAQAEASDPFGSAWVSANAGSGKTYVLAQRVIRLLLSGADPGRILCLTFTRAAAAEMASRVFARLSEWTRLPDNKLAARITEVEGKRPDADTIAEARRLFARALETPGGLKIQTIHAFCERLLHQFPFEAGVAGHFEVLDERDVEALADKARRRVLARAAKEPDGTIGRALKTALDASGDFVLEQAIREAVSKRDRLRAWIVRKGSLDLALEELGQDLGVTGTDTGDAIRHAILGESVLRADLGELLIRLRQTGGTNDGKAADRLEPVLAPTDERDRTEAYRDFWTTSDQKTLRKTSGLASKAIKDDWPGLQERLDEERERLSDLFDRMATVDCFEATAALMTLADAVIGEYERMKRVRSVLDFEDLIVGTANLLQRSDAARWVQYKLDRGIDHILVDEAQDTSPRQWEVVRALAEEFFAGEATERGARTLFAVGDEKQSIFSFQGAIPAWFDRMRSTFGERARAGGYTFTDPSLHLSFRSTDAVLSAVDAVFEREAAHRGLSVVPGPTTHKAARRNVPGEVVIWPMIEPPEQPEPQNWTSPVDHLGDDSPEVQLANRIADTITGWLHREERLPSKKTPIRPGDILILTRSRGAQTDAINRALKTRRVPIAGADRLSLTEHIAVMDLMALGRVMLLPEDDLSLAAVLKSPLIGLDEDALFAIAHARGKVSLWWALGEAAMKLGGVYSRARERLDNLLGRVDFEDPYTFYARILADPDYGRRQFLRRLGTEAEDLLDEFLAQALAYQENHTPSLQGFLAWLDAAETQVRRDTDTIRDEVRVMTVHGAKGLEADIVFLVDIGQRPVHAAHDPRIVGLSPEDTFGGPLVWVSRNRDAPALVTDRIKAIREEAAEEYRRLLYVGLTRARDRLYVCGTLKQRATDAVGGWHALVTSALEPNCTERPGPDGITELVWKTEEVDVLTGKGRQEAMTFRPRKPDWLDQPAAPAPPTVQRISPSLVSAGDTATRGPRSPASPGGPDDAAERGRLIHRLLQTLPDLADTDREPTARRYLDSVAAGWTPEDRTALLGEVMAVMNDPTFTPVFAPGSRAEIEISGRFGERVLSGRIDRLAVSGSHVFLVDFKTNRQVPESRDQVPHDYVIQLSLYDALLRELYPDRSRSAAILWTRQPVLMEFPAAFLEETAKRVLSPQS